MSKLVVVLGDHNNEEVDVGEEQRLVDQVVLHISRTPFLFCFFFCLIIAKPPQTSRWCSTQSTLMQTTTMISLCSDFNVLSPSQSKRISHLCDPLNLNPPPLRYILPICLPRPGLSVQGRRGYVTGWGRTYDGGPYPILLNQVNVRRRTTE